MSVQVLRATRPRQLSEVVKVELHPDFSRESGPVAAGTAIDLGTVLGKLTVSGNLVPFNPAGADGSQEIVGVSQRVVEAEAEDDDRLVYSARGTVLSASGLRWPDAISAPQKAAALVDLTAMGLIVRDF